MIEQINLNKSVWFEMQNKRVHKKSFQVNKEKVVIFVIVNLSLLFHIYMYLNLQFIKGICNNLI